MGSLRKFANCYNGGPKDGQLVEDNEEKFIYFPAPTVQHRYRRVWSVKRQEFVYLYEGVIS